MTSSMNIATETCMNCLHTCKYYYIIAKYSIISTLYTCKCKDQGNEEMLFVSVQVFWKKLLVIQNPTCSVIDVTLFGESEIIIPCYFFTWPARRNPDIWWFKSLCFVNIKQIYQKNRISKEVILILSHTLNLAWLQASIADFKRLMLGWGSIFLWILVDI